MACQCARHKQQIQERGRGRQQLDAMAFNRLAHGVGGSVARDDGGTAVRKRVEKGVHTPDVVEAEKCERPQRCARRCVARQQPGDAEENRLRSSGRTRGEQDHTRLASTAQRFEERMIPALATPEVRGAVFRDLVFPRDTGHSAHPVVAVSL